MKKLLFLLSFACLTIIANAQTAYITNSNSSCVSVINVATNTVIDTIIVGSSPRGVSVSPDGTKVYVANAVDNTVSVINTATNTVSATITVGTYPAAFGNFISSYGDGIAPLSMVSEDISAYPNPAINSLTIKTLQKSTIEISNIQGKLTKSIATTGNKTNIDVSTLAKGMYFIKVISEKGVESRKFIKL